MFIFKYILETLVSPFTKIVNTYLENQRNKTKLKYGSLNKAMETSSKISLAIISSALLQIPLFILLFAIDLHIAIVFIDSTFPMEELTPLKLPSDYSAIMNTAAIGQLGAGGWWLARGGKF